MVTVLTRVVRDLSASREPLHRHSHHDGSVVHTDNTEGAQQKTLPDPPTERSRVQTPLAHEHLTLLTQRASARTRSSVCSQLAASVTCDYRFFHFVLKTQSSNINGLNRKIATSKPARVVGIEQTSRKRQEVPSAISEADGGRESVRGIIAVSRIHFQIPHWRLASASQLAHFKLEANHWQKESYRVQ